jgi:hypothetical protein
MKSVSNILFLSFYTTGYYKTIAHSYLIPSLEKFNLPHKIIEKESKHDWLLNGKYKTEVIYSTLLETDKDIVFLDADAKLLQFPQLFFEIPESFDIGVHYLDWWLFWHNQPNKTKKELLTGTIFFRNNNKVKSLVREWNSINQSSAQWAQRILPELFNKYPDVKIFELPQSYCKIIKSNNIITSDDIIIQCQASREAKIKENL